MASDKTQVFYAQAPTGKKEQVFEFDTGFGGKIKVVNYPCYATQSPQEKKQALLEALDAKQTEIEALHKQYKDIQSTRADLSERAALDTSHFEIKRNRALFMAMRRDFIDTKLAYVQKKLNGEFTESKDNTRVKTYFEDLAGRITIQERELKKISQEKQSSEEELVALEARLQEVIAEYTRAVYKSKHSKLVLDRMQSRNRILAAECKKLSGVKGSPSLHKGHFRV